MSEDDMRPSGIFEQFVAVAVPWDSDDSSAAPTQTLPQNQSTNLFQHKAVIDR